ncbi:hypothetical protein [Paracraurococcus lichenis]|uniref:Uncharacterized protein n=1 Tax=Paracraurococcus lichenis TaxID=3064888 RepID=A0ABT9DZW9_9PROT|nr:hypothetical protein [Paracraurococcus sp. LOR1-02]MDO9709290.1 hypothetical protein [Paracraurococcus sp. LOR1-02]
MRRRPILLLALTPIAGARAESPAEQASRQLQRDLRRDRAAEAGGPEGPRPPEATPTVRALDADRRSLQPDVGRPEEDAAPVTGGERAATGGGRNPQR